MKKLTNLALLVVLCRWASMVSSATGSIVKRKAIRGSALYPGEFESKEADDGSITAIFHDQSSLSFDRIKIIQQEGNELDPIQHKNQDSSQKTNQNIWQHENVSSKQHQNQIQVGSRNLQSNLQITFHNIRLDLISTDGGESNVPAFLSQSIHDSIMNLLRQILNRNLGSDLELLEVTFVNGNGDTRNNTKYSIYTQVKVRHPPYVTPSANSYILKALRDNTIEIVDYLITLASIEGNDESFHFVEQVDMVQIETYSIDDLSSLPARPTQSPTPRPTPKPTMNVKISKHPLQLTIEGVGDDVVNSLPDGTEDAILSLLGDVLRNSLETDVSLVDISLIESGRKLATFGGTRLDTTTDNSHRRRLATLRLFVEITVEHPRWMTSSYAGSRVLLALNNSANEVEEYLRSGIHWGFTGITGVYFGEFDSNQVFSSARPTQQPTQRPTPPPTNRPTSEPTIAMKETLHRIRLNFDGVTNSVVSSEDVALDLADLASEVIKDNLRRDIELLDVRVIDENAILDGISSGSRRLAVLTLPLEISVKHPASVSTSFVFEILIQMLAENVNVFGPYIGSIPGNGKYDAEEMVEVLEYSLYQSDLSYDPTKSPSRQPVVGKKSDSFLVDIVFPGISPYYILSEKMKSNISDRMEKILEKNLEHDVELIDISLKPEDVGLTSSSGARYLSDEEALMDWLTLPVLIVLRYPVNEQYDDTFKHLLRILSANTEVIDNYLHYDVGEDFDELTSVELRYHSDDFIFEPTSEPTAVPNLPETEISTNAGGLPWWAWLIFGIIGVAFFCVFGVFFALFAGNKKEVTASHIYRDNISVSQSVKDRIRKKHREARERVKRKRPPERRRRRSRENHRRLKKSKHPPPPRQKSHPRLPSSQNQPLLQLPPSQQDFPRLPPAQHDYPMLPPAQHEYPMLPPIEHTPFALHPPPKQSTNKPKQNHHPLLLPPTLKDLPNQPPVIRRATEISSLHVSLYPSGTRISSAMKGKELKERESNNSNAISLSTAMVVYDPVQAKAPDPEERIRPRSETQKQKTGSRNTERNGRNGHMKKQTNRFVDSAQHRHGSNFKYRPA